MRRWIRLCMFGALVFFSHGASAQNLLTNGGLELELGDFGGADSVPPGWQMLEGRADPQQPDLSTAEPGNFFHLLHEGEWHMWYQPYAASFEPTNHGGFAHLFQDVPATPGLSYTLTGWSLFEAHYPGGVDFLNLPGTDASNPFDGPPSPTDSHFAIEFLDAANALLAGSVDLELKAGGQMNDSTWRQHTLTAVAPAGTVSVRVRASMTGGRWNEGADPQSYFTDDFILTADEPAGPAADFDADLDVDGADFLIWQRGHGIAAGAARGQGDATEDGDVDAQDLAKWTSEFGTAAAAGAIPEPSAVWLAALGLAAMAARRRAA